MPHLSNDRCRCLARTAQERLQATQADKGLPNHGSPVKTAKNAEFARQEDA